MMRTNLSVRALFERVRGRGAIQIIAGLLLIAPAGVVTWSDLHRDAAQPVVIEMEPLQAVATSAATAQAYAQEYRISATLARDIHQAATDAGVSPKVAFGLVRAESSFRPAAVSPVGAVGLTQLMPSTARWLEPGISRQALRNPETNLRVGFTYLRSLIDKYEGNEQLALTAFNRGPGTVDKLLKRGANPDNGYAEKVLTGKSARHVALMNAKFGRRS